MTYINNKTQKIYTFIEVVVNKTNKNDGERLVIYKDLEGKKYAREITEFHEKFSRKIFEEINQLR
jgi:hypothetical protein